MAEHTPKTLYDKIFDDHVVDRPTAPACSTSTASCTK